MRAELDARAGAPADARDAPLVAFAYALACGALALSGLFPLNNPDTFGHLAQGRQIAQLGHVPARDTLSFWQAQPVVWHNYEWLSDWLSWRLYQLGGADALVVGKCLLLALSAALIVRVAQLYGSARAAAWCALLIVLAIPAARFRFTERPHLVTLPFAAIYLIGFGYLVRAWGEGTRRGDVAWIAAIGCVHVLWVNLHGSHLLGLLLSGVYFVFAFRDRAARAKLAAVLGVELVASCISPYGPAILIDAVEHVVDPVYRTLVTEWQPWQPTDPLWLLLAPIVQGLLLAASVRTLSRAGTAQRALLACACALGLASFRSIRFVAEFLLLSAPPLAIAFARWSQAWSERSMRAVFVALALIAAALVPWASRRLPPYTAIGHGLNNVGLPASSGEWLATHARAPRVLAAIEDSWYLMFAVPQARFLVDGRVPFYGPEHIQRVSMAFADPARLDQLLAQYRVDTVVPRHTFKAHQALVQSMRARPGWTLVSVEDRYSVFVRSDLQLQDGGRPRALALEPSYEAGWLLEADAAREQAIRAALGELPESENNRGYKGWVRAMLSIKPLRRPGEGNGLRPPESAAETATLRKARDWLERAAAGAEGVPIVHAYHALVCAALCDVECAEHALHEARWEGDSRETLLGAQEVALRRGQNAEVAEFLARAEHMPGASGDAWLTALRASLHTPPRCP